VPLRVVAPRLAAAVAVLAVAACGSGATSSSAPPVSASPGGASGIPSASGTQPGGSDPQAGPVWLPEWAADSDVPDAVATRRALPFCGIEVAPAPQPGIFVDRAVRLCFWEAHQAGREAEFVSVQSTMEGAPIATIYRLAADGTVEVLTDFTQDAFGGGAWTVQTCEEVVEAEGDELVGVSDCTEGPPLE
jgi:hypothetical protein